MSANISIVSIVATDVDHNNAYSPGDIVTITFSEPIYAAVGSGILAMRTSQDPTGTQAFFMTFWANGDYATQFTETIPNPYGSLINAYVPGETFSINRVFVFNESNQIAYSDVTFTLPSVTSSAPQDTTAPTVNTFNPADGATGVAVNHDVGVTFSESIQRGTGIITIHSGSADGPVVESYNAATSTNLTLSGSTLIINPTADLVNSNHYYVTFSAGSVKDLAGNSYAGTTSYDFTTESPILTPMLRNGISVMPERYTGPATAAGGAAIHFQYIGDSTGEVVIGTAYNDFINVAGGVDAVNAGAGNDVIDGGTDSNFLTGGAGIDIFFSDGRGGVTTWSTITDWQAGEQLSVWGWHPGTSRIVEWTQAGAAGYEGLTMHADLNGDGTIDTSVTFTGITSQSQLPTPLEFDGVLWFV
jgi:Ca2+-binding RTX toxin-like protein